MAYSLSNLNLEPPTGRVTRNIYETELRTFEDVGNLIKENDATLLGFFEEYVTLPNENKMRLFKVQWPLFKNKQGFKLQTAVHLAQQWIFEFQFF